MATTTQLVTADDLYRMGEDAPYELIRGVLRQVTPTTGKHGWVIMQFGWQLGSYVYPQHRGVIYGGEAGFIIDLDPDTILAADLAYIRTERLPAEEDEERGFMPVIPDLVVEVISPSNRRRDVEEKTELYLNAGVPLLWWFDPLRRSVSVFRPGAERQVLTEQETLDGGEILPGFQISVAEIFRRPSHTTGE